MSFSSVSIQYEIFVTRIILVNYEELFHHFFSLFHDSSSKLQRGYFPKSIDASDHG